jgi:acyl transferase domain-containing protein/NAD(P)H-dependent flavin oxidoreductase YrpB (nitropropane dioxygenase family)/NAD(P)-dependent dehydrogenase (short-subunit alcohol dehydrogenase family)
VVVDVVSVDEALAAVAAGADGVVVTGAEAGGRVGETGTFVLLQQVLAAVGDGVPVWAHGGIGPRTAAAARVGGATGVVLDVQVALAAEAAGCCGPEVAQAISAMDGSETRLLGGWRLLHRPNTLAARLPEDTDAGTVAGLVGGTDLATELVPAGQDASLAGPLARAHGSVGRIVAAVQRAFDEHLAAADRVRPLAGRSKLATAHGLAVPVAQGPMTRVSDRAAFANAVAEAGGLPFLALSLLRGPEVRQLLTETAELLGPKRWGVGILGFVPPELRQEQLEVVHEVRPPVALIAGGRPSQAAPLEAAGICTFLHVPSPGLLARFLRDGARRFVFEGRECGGHVGPRPSFLLWEQQLDTLDAFAEAGGADGRGGLAGVELLFAGGVHDERSAAMVATLAAPAADRGAAIGVLMGTAYLFCEEAVQGGAIVPAFQETALECEATTLLETSPGHATRCVASPYVAAFEATKRKLADAGASSSEMWAELEQLNLGRLRIAAKGLERQGDQVVEVDEETQRREGMYMIGDVATLRSERTTVAALHRQVSDGATRWVAERAAARAVGDGSRRRSSPTDVAIVGMACVFPGAADLDAFWAQILEGADAVSEVSPERWDPEVYFDAENRPDLAGVKSPSKWGGFLDPVPFDALAYGIPPASLAAIEPVQLLALEMAARALADAGYDRRPFDRHRTGVVFGAESCSDLATAYGIRTMLPTIAGKVPEALDSFLPKMTEDSFAGMLANVIAGRIANRLDLGGANCTVDAACAASLAALDAACKELLVGDSDMVLCGGADLHNGIQDYLLFGSVHALSPSGRCKTFDADADGIVLGEGVACVVLKRLADAERDGDRIYAVIKAVAGSSDGRHLGLTAPRKEGQRVALEQAYARAGLSPAEVGLVEAHGTGTVVGDRTELATLAEVFAEHGASPGSCSIGSVKSNVGHTKCAAGLAGLIKAALAVHHGVRPPTLHVQHPNQAWDPDTSPFRFESSARPWTAECRVAGVSSFGFGGANYHVVLASPGADLDDPSLDGDGRGDPVVGQLSVAAAVPAAHGRRQWPAELVVLRGADWQQAAAEADRLHQWLVAADAAGSTVSLRSVAAGAAERARRSSAPVQAAVVAESRAELQAQLRAVAAVLGGRAGVLALPAGTFVAPAARREERLGAQPTAVAFCFPGQGSQRPGMLSDLFVAFPGLRRWLRAGAEWADVMLPPAAFGTEERRRQVAALTDTRVAQPSLGVADLATADLLVSAGIRPGMLGGHSYGELVALAVAGSLDTASLLALSTARAAAILDAAGDDPGTMASVAADTATVRAALAAEGLDDVVVANHNAPRQAVISGPSGSVARAVEILTQAGIRSSALPVACAFHSPVVAGASGSLAAHLERVPVSPPTIPVWSNALAAPYPADPDQVRGLLVRQVAEPVRWVEQVEAMYDAGARIFIEVGPGRVLTGLVGKILGNRPHLAVACDVAGEPGLRRLLLTLAELAVNGVEADLTFLFDGRTQPADLSADPVPGPRWVVNGHLVRTRDGAVVPGSLRPLSEVPRRALIAAEDADAVVVRASAAPPSPALRATTSATSTSSSGTELVAPSTYDTASVAEATVPGAGGDRMGPALTPPAWEAPGHGNVPAPSHGAGLGPVEETITAFLDSMRLAVAAQRDVLLRYLGAEPAPLEAAPLASAPSRLVDTTPSVVERPEPTPACAAASANATVAHGAAAGGSVDAAGAVPAGAVPAGAAPTGTQPVTLPTGAVPAGGAPAGVGSAGTVPAGASVVDPVELLAVVTSLVAERTGYPLDMLDPGQDLEADLSIDSIKRIEVLGELAERVGLPTGADGDVEDAVIEELAQIKTMQGIVDWIVAHVAPAGGSVEAAGAVPARGAPAGVGSAGAPPVAAAAGGSSGSEALAVRDRTAAGTERADPVLTSSGALATSGAPAGAVRLSVTVVDAPPAAPQPATVLASTSFAIVDDGRGAALALAEQLESHGARVRIVGADDRWWGDVVDTPAAERERLDGVIDLNALAGDADASARRSFPALRAGVVLGARWLVAVSATGGRLGRQGPASSSGDRPGLPPGAGLAGLCRTLALEVPDAVVRAVDVDPKVEPELLARLVVDELLDSAGPTVVCYAAGRRRTLDVVQSPVADRDLAGVVADSGLGPDSVAVLIGGARGITATVGRALAATTGARLVLVGRTDPTEPEDAATAAVPSDPVALRAALAAAGMQSPAEVERRVRSILARRQVRATLDELAAAGTSVTYEVADVADPAALVGLLEAVVERFGRIDLVVHGAGHLEDKLVVDKQPDAFGRVFDTKVAPAKTLAGWLVERGPSLGAACGRRPTLVLFGSVSGVFGNRGQADYAAANDALDTLAWSMAGHEAVRVVAIDWGPWGGGAGMVTPELEQLYRRRGIGLLEPASAVAHLLRELAEDRGEAQVVVADADAATLAGPP